jgi:hypothetical protein
VGSLVLVRLLALPTERVLEECQICMLERDARYRLQGGSLRPDRDAAGADQRAALPARAQRSPRALQLKRAIVVPNAEIAHLARIAFGGSEYRVFYDDLQSAKDYLRDAAPSPAPTGACG